MISLASSFPSIAYRARGVIWRLLRHIGVYDDVSCLATLAPGLKLTQRAVNGFVHEIANSAILRDTTAKYGRLSHDGITDWPMKLAATSRGAILLLYVLSRVVKPKVVIETGCFTGLYSSFILYAMHLNGAGHLYSIDLPAQAGQFRLEWGLPDGVSPGFLVPEGLRHRWTLVIGNVRDELMPLLSQLRQVDMFFHDSDHSYEHMMWEFTSIWPHLSRGGLLVSDDISLNTSFWDFSTAMGSAYVIHRSTANLGALVKG